MPPELFPTNTRYAGSGIAYNAASILGAALTPFVATWLAASYGPGSVGLYLACLGGSTLAALILSKETRATNREIMEQNVTTEDLARSFFRRRVGGLASSCGDAADRFRPFVAAAERVKGAAQSRSFASAKDLVGARAES